MRSFRVSLLPLEKAKPNSKKDEGENRRLRGLRAKMDASNQYLEKHFNDALKLFNRNWFQHYD